MGQQRRNILKGGAALAAASMLPGNALAKASGYARRTGDSLDLPTHVLHEAMIDYFSGKGYELVDHVPIVTGDESFNGGLRYDETGIDNKPGQMAIQPCARIEDIQKKGQLDVLPLFHIFYCMTPLGLKPADTLAQVLDYLTNNVGLNSQYFAFVTVPEFELYFPVLEEYGFDPNRQVHIRDSEEALVMGDGSGYFRFPGNRDALAFATAGIYYWTGTGAPPELTAYPPQKGWTEIGETSIDETANFGFGLGTERVGLAATREIPSWQERLVLLFEQIEIHSGGNPPPGRDRFSNG
ncbi:hypothetical protein [Hoeflea sp. TYP-13]|uniref:hypothetical protein n=1 Tax=Hoeflea sp. TYP-13 TaxID=3230023 RepID=UPI0034C5D77F